jgi:uncharacterized protein
MEPLTEQVTQMLIFIIQKIAHIWPLLLLTAPLAVLINQSGIAARVAGVLNAKPVKGIFGATAIGAFSPFCSCSVIPVITGLLIAGVPLAPIMGFWMASPSMDPEIFLLSAAVLGWELAIWRLAGTLVISLGGAFITHWLVKAGWFTGGVLKSPILPENSCGKSCTGEESVKTPPKGFKLPSLQNLIEPSGLVMNPVFCCAAAGAGVARVGRGCGRGCGSGCGSGTDANPINKTKLFADFSLSSFFKDLWKVSTKILMFMAIAYFIEGIILFYISESFIKGLLGSNNIFSIPIALAAGIPAYMTNLSALGISEGLLAQGSDPAAVLAFLLSGATTTLPAMAAVYGITKKRVFILYISLAAGGSFLVALVYKLFLLFF